MRDIFNKLPAFSVAARSMSARSVTGSYLLSLLIFILALALRFWLDPYMPAGFPYVTFFPAVVISGFVFGVRQGVAVAVLSGFSAWYFFIPPFFALDFSAGTMIAMGLYVFVVATDLVLIAMATHAYRAERAARGEVQKLAERQEVMAQELDHRLKNVFATINAIISLSQTYATDVRDFAARLRDRLSAMGRSNLLLRGLRAGEETTLDVLVRQALEPFGINNTARLALQGSHTSIGGQAVIVLGLIFHELGTNAAKYGSLSVPGGKVSIDWVNAPTDDTDAESLVLTWRETGGPAPVAADAEKAGFGSTLIRRVIGAVNGTSAILFQPDGAEIRLTIPMTMLQPEIVA